MRWTRIFTAEQGGSIPAREISLICIRLGLRMVIVLRQNATTVRSAVGSRDALEYARTVHHLPCPLAAVIFPGHPYLFFAVPYSRVFLNNNGVLSFNSPISAYVAVPFPIIGNAMIAPLCVEPHSSRLLSVHEHPSSCPPCSWADVDTRPVVPGAGGFATFNDLYYRAPATPSAADAARMKADVASSLPDEPPFNPSMMAVFTWFAVGRYNLKVDLLSTFQVAIASDAGEQCLCVLATAVRLLDCSKWLQYQRARL